MSAPGSLARAILGARRKLASSLERRGVAGTMTRAVIWPALAARRWKPANRRAARAGRDFDRRHGVDTARGMDAGWAASLDGPSWKSAIGYNPVAPEDFHRALAFVPVEPGRTVFVDFGAGKGRAVLLATHYPFRRVLGVELSRDLHEVAAANLARYRPAERICHVGEVVQGDALSYPIPDEPIVLFFYDPFRAEVFAPLLERIRRSLAERPRPAWIVYHYPRCGALVETAGFRRVGGGPHTAIYRWENGGAR